MDKLQSFAPVIDNKPRVLIVGSMPSIKSLEEQEYYGNPRNHFWSIMYRILEEKPCETYAEKIHLIKKNYIALWDTIGYCYRQGSLDMYIEEEEPNDIAGLLKEYPTIQLIACNGTKAYQMYKKFITPLLQQEIDVIKLPSTSPVPGKYNKTFEEKIESWRVITNYLDDIKSYEEEI
ncbi:DNA-deoxyinosine glycosylase [Oceanobacillus neutriphilus]|uniref:DNA-deoxyinosine glycosylase n=1 Tax=Oceanobacillus neutriphilus TaxID=531815 RepID=A0ABQ2NRG8_9BACI|nr:DNA-deoxyinosine glycosylase [Oceanobacillus neutriphilus]GGP09427.1 DNA-deoxyinosine glycosylase [Oceanobacillus neutriphilus]